MFSSGNTTERKRMGQLSAQGEIVVDMYAGIGYFTIPLLKNAGEIPYLTIFFFFKFSHNTCEWNPDSIEALQRNLENNKVSNRCTIFNGDNLQTTGDSSLFGKIDRVILGLLPTAERSCTFSL
eukprot:GSMAST32.ASY1.ANO1.1774.1 assembled CDS